jgi:hypothetical protein
MSDLKIAIKQLNFRWLPKYLNHIAENIVFKKRNISFLAINALFRQENNIITNSEAPFTDSFVISGIVPILPNDRLRTISNKMSVVFRLDDHNNIIPITAYSENDEK